MYYLKVSVKMYPELTLELGKSIYIFKTYNVFMFLSILFGLSVSYIQLKKYLKHSLLFLVSLVISFIIGARLLNYFVNYSFYQKNSISLFKFKTIGFSFYGGILASLIFLLFYKIIFDINLWTITDKMILPFGISFFIMRIGCFLNGCCYGKITNSFLGIKLPKESSNLLVDVFSNTIKVHPTQLYEGFGALLGVIFLSLYKRKIKTKGLLTLYYGIYLTVVRWFVLYFRNLKYDKWIINFFYPLIYFMLITFGIFNIWKLKRNES